MTRRLDGKVAIITGGTSGIGEATAEKFVAEGAQVAIAGRSEEAGTAVARRLGEGAIFVPTDVTEPEEIEALVAHTHEHFGRVDCLFNNAGAARPVWSIEQVTPEDIRAELDLLVSSVLLASKQVTPIMKRQGEGSIINNASIAALESGWGGLVYSAAKGAVVSITKWVASELAPHGIRVNAISPGAVVTPIFWRGSGSDQAEAPVRQSLSEMTAFHRLGEPEDIAALAAFLASDEGSYVTGQDIASDGGLTTGRSYPEMMRTFGEMAARVAGQGRRS